METKSIKGKVILLKRDVEKRTSGQVCMNNIQMFKWTEIHESNNVLNLLPEYNNTKFNHIYILTDEDIKMGDYYYKETFNEIFKGSGYLDSDKKVIASTENLEGIPKLKQSFINKYIEKFNKGKLIEEINIDYYSTYDSKNGIQFIPCINQHNEITVKKIKDSWSKKELDYEIMIAVAMFASERKLTPTSDKMKVVNEWAQNHCKTIK